MLLILVTKRVKTIHHQLFGTICARHGIRGRDHRQLRAALHRAGSDRGQRPRPDTPTDGPPWSPRTAYGKCVHSCVPLINLPMTGMTLTESTFCRVLSNKAKTPACVWRSAPCRSCAAKVVKPNGSGRGSGIVVFIQERPNLAVQIPQIVDCLVNAVSRALVQLLNLPHLDRVFPICDPHQDRMRGRRL